jgi:phosphatidylinositol kinase/protein kinase (PI-3  family)
MPGIGDRHTDNLLIDLTSGAVIQIDFGMTFGVGTSVLPVPELLPFRLTRQLFLLEPLDSLGYVRQIMIRCLETFHCVEAQDRLRTTLESYLHDPILDWIGKSPLVQKEDLLGGSLAMTSSLTMTGTHDQLTGSSTDFVIEKQVK